MTQLDDKTFDQAVTRGLISSNAKSKIILELRGKTLIDSEFAVEKTHQIIQEKIFSPLRCNSRLILTFRRIPRPKCAPASTDQYAEFAKADGHSPKSRASIRSLNLLEGSRTNHRVG